MNIVIIDYRAGNSASIMNAFEKLGVTASVSASPSDWRKADAIVFPGVGSFGSAMKYLGKDSAVLRQLIAEGVPFLGICLGMQVLMDWSEESPTVPGLGIIPGIARRFPEGLPVPQIGWNKVRVGSSPIFEGLKEFYAYFVNSYYCVPEDRSWVA
ncbi:TPA: imidazole glycerol phosphate synthase subunit HisH, partial [Candidatus Micrarchaeota archaeon]|nr:imidazole glycerol phosphate synthase subunit HisH [Candidatus Micrarchaeota archaeon]